MILTEGKIQFLNDEMSSQIYDIDKILRCDFLFSDFILIGKISTRRGQGLFHNYDNEVNVEFMVDFSDLDAEETQKIVKSNEIPLVVGHKTIGFYNLEKIIMSSETVDNHTKVRSNLRMVSDENINLNEFYDTNLPIFRAWNKGELFRNNQVRAFSNVSIGTDFIECFDITESIKLLELIILSNLDVLIKFKSKYSFSYYIDIIIEVYNGVIPSLILDNSFIKTAALIDASIDIDLEMM